MASQFTTPNSNQITRRTPWFLGSLFAAIVFISAAQGQSAYIRVNQVGYPSAESKRAYLMATGSENGTTFVVKNSAGITVYSGAVGATLGAWGSFPFVYPIDFDSVSATGTYTIAVTSPIAANSPSFKIDAAANIYANPLSNTLFFYQTQRDGPNYVPNALRTAPGHLNDQSAKVYLTPRVNAGSGRFSGDLTPTGAVIKAPGGWWDAGEYVKLVQTASSTLAGRLTADFALCYHAYQTSNSLYANQCLLSAEHIFDLANTAPAGNLLTVIPFSFYPETEWRDDLELGAVELYFALQAGSNLPPGLPHTDPAYYLQQAAQWANAYITGPNDASDTLNLYDVSGLAHYELDRALTLAANPSGLATSQAALLADLKKQLDKAVMQAGTDPFGFGFTWAAWDTTSHGAGLAVMASEYGNLTGSPAYTPYGNRWLANILGANAWGSSFIVGDGSTFPNCLQHQVANLAGALNGTSPILLGGGCGGSQLCRHQRSSQRHDRLSCKRGRCVRTIQR